VFNNEHTTYLKAKFEAGHLILIAAAAAFETNAAGAS